MSNKNTELCAEYSIKKTHVCIVIKKPTTLEKKLSALLDLKKKIRFNLFKKFRNI